MSQLEDSWYAERPQLWAMPVSWLFRGLAAARRGAYNTGLLKSYPVDVPVIVVGNISVGGTGKTPLVTWLVKLLKKAGYRPGIVSRGYGGQAKRWPQQVRIDSDPQMVGDEPVMLAQMCDCPVVAAPDRVAAAQQLLKYSDCDLIITDDGLQHYRLQRDIEIVVVDGQRRFGNGYCLPAGPLREPVSRLDEVDFVVSNGPAARGEFPMSLVSRGLVSLLDSNRTLAFEKLISQPVHAVAGIGNPGRFFQLLKDAGFQIIEHPFADHHQFSETDLHFGDEQAILMTAKDAVKCQRYGRDNMWIVPVEAQLPDSFALRLLQMIKALNK